MVFRMFVGGIFDNTHERKQMDRIRRTLQRVYESSKDQWCCLFADVTIDNFQIDGIILKNDKLIVLDMKDRKELGVRSTESREWYPLKQLNKRIAAFNGLSARIRGSAFPDGKSERFIVGWIVVPEDASTEEATRVVNSASARNARRIKVLRINEIGNEIGFHTSLRELQFGSERVVDIYAKRLRATEKDPDFWLKATPDESLLRERNEKYLIDPTYFSNWRSKVEEIDDSKDEKLAKIKLVLRNLDFGKFRFRGLDNLLASRSNGDVIQGIRIVSVIGLPQYAADLIRLIESSKTDIRYNALEALQSLDYDQDITSNLLKLVRDDDPKVRQLAFKLLISSGSTSATPELVNMLEEGTEEEVETAMRALAEVGDQRAVPSLIALSENYHKRFPESGLRESDLIRSVIKTLGRIGSDRAEAVAFVLHYLDDRNAIRKLVEKDIENRRMGRMHLIRDDDLLKELLQDEDDDTKYVAAVALGEIAPRGARDSLLRLLDQENDSRVKAAVIWSLGAIGGEDVATRLHPYLEKSDDSIFEATIKALGKVRSATSFSPIWNSYERATREGKAFRQRIMINTLSSLDPRKTETFLLGSLERETNKEVRCAAAEFIYDVSSEKSIEALLTLLSDPDDNIRLGVAGAIAAAMRRSIGEEAIPTKIAELLRSQNTFLREGAVSVLGGIGKDVDAVRLLSGLTNDTSKLVRRAVIRSLGYRLFRVEGTTYMLNEEPVRLLIEIIDAGKDAGQQTEALIILSKAADMRISSFFAKSAKIPLPNSLKTLLNSTDPKIRARGVSVAAHFWGDGALGLIEPLREDESIEVRRTLVDSLFEIGTQECLYQLEGLKSDKDASVARVAAHFYNLLRHK